MNSQKWIKLDKEPVKLIEECLVGKARKAEYNKRWRSKNREWIRQYDNQHYATHKNQHKLSPESKIKRVAYQQMWYRKNKEKVAEYNRKYKLSHISEIQAYRKVYGPVYRARTKTLRNKNEKERRAQNPLYKATGVIRNLIGNAIRNGGYTKKTRTESILGCSFTDFKTYMENQFKPGMTWLNHGEWHIDHRLPVSLAQDESELIKLNHHTNLQPLWATSKIAEKYGEVNYIGNLEKHDNIIQYE